MICLFCKFPMATNTITKDAVECRYCGAKFVVKIEVLKVPTKEVQPNGPRK